MKKLVTMSLGICALLGCRTSNIAQDIQADKIGDYRRLDIPPPAPETAPDRFKDTVYGFSYARPEAAIDRFYSEWKMTYAASPSRGMYVLRSYEFDNTLPKVALQTSIASPSSNVDEAIAKFQQRFTASSGLVSFERVTIDGRPAAIAQYRMINPIDTFMMYQCLIPDSVRSVSLMAYSPYNDFNSYKETFRKVMMSTHLMKPNIPVQEDGC